LRTRGGRGRQGWHTPPSNSRAELGQAHPKSPTAHRNIVADRAPVLVQCLPADYGVRPLPVPSFSRPPTLYYATAQRDLEMLSVDADGRCDAIGPCSPASARHGPVSLSATDVTRLSSTTSPDSNSNSNSARHDLATTALRP